MDPVTGYWVEFAELTSRERLAWGNAGNSTMLSCVYAGTSYVYKEYSDEFRAAADQNALGSLIRWRDKLPTDDRRHLDRIAAWPRYRVRHNGVLLGVLMPFAPKQFFARTYPDGLTQPNVIANLVMRQIDGKVVTGASVQAKRSAIGNAADILLWFHRQNVYVNDVRELNILCSESGSAAYFVDCDVMIGPWGGVGPVAAPEYLLELLPGTRLSREVELARLAWVAVWILLDDFSLRHVPQARLTKVIDAGDADLIERTALRQAIRLDDWRRLAGRWIKWTASARVGEPEIITPRPWLPPTRRMPEPEPEPSGGWLPPRYRREKPAAPAMPASALSPEPAPARERWPTVTLAAVLAALLLSGLLAAALLAAALLRGGG